MWVKNIERIQVKFRMEDEEHESIDNMIHTLNVQNLQSWVNSGGLEVQNLRSHKF